jgi:hypothetical protein
MHQQKYLIDQSSTSAGSTNMIKPRFQNIPARHINRYIYPIAFPPVLAIFPPKWIRGSEPVKLGHATNIYFATFVMAFIYLTVGPNTAMEENPIIKATVAPYIADVWLPLMPLIVFSNGLSSSGISALFTVVLRSSRFRLYPLGRCSK